ncbi:RNA-binding ASCH domain protein [Melia azedarach]|uniref:RNA-binding ASCH domain protein n=1 Tax=Melia azedarach TaxID=155640 RepID=A0ACC1YLQ3_MELAZ|nr:RNA-binding ASCH domain protein [Melia azedarach]
MEQPSSPGTKPVNIRECIEEGLKFTLESHLNRTLQLDLGLSKDFCSFLLDHVPLTADSSDKESQYPLYKRLASVLHESVTSAQSCGVFSNIALVNGDNDVEKREEWNELVIKEGFEIVNLLKTINFELHVQEPFFTQIKDGAKPVEGRCAVGDYNRIASGALILFNKSLVAEVQDVRRYQSFSEMLQAESLAKVLPGIKTIDEGVQVYRRFYTEEKEKTNGVLAICVATLADQPFLSLARILSGLSYVGLQSLLGLTDYTATVEPHNRHDFAFTS